MNKINLKLYRLKNAAIVIAFPVIAFLIMEVLCRVIADTHVFNNFVDVRNYARMVISAFAIALGLSMNMFVGRFDFSLGAQMALSAIIGGNIALYINGGSITMILLSMLIAIPIGALVGLVFVKLKIHAMILGLGFALIYECVAYALFDSGGLNIYGNQKMALLSNMWFIITVALLLLAVTTYLYDGTVFGYKLRAIQGNQSIASDCGINISAHAVVCYILGAVLVSIAGCFEASYNGVLTAELGLGSMSLFGKNLQAILVGMFIASRWSNSSVALFTSVLSLQMMKLGLSKLGISSNMQTVYYFVIFFLFLLYRENADNIDFYFAKKKRIRLARQRYKELDEQGKIPAYAKQD